MLFKILSISAVIAGVSAQTVPLTGTVVAGLSVPGGLGPVILGRTTRAEVDATYADSPMSCQGRTRNRCSFTAEDGSGEFVGQVFITYANASNSPGDIVDVIRWTVPDWETSVGENSLSSIEADCAILNQECDTSALLSSFPDAFLASRVESGGFPALNFIDDFAGIEFRLSTRGNGNGSPAVTSSTGILYAPTENPFNVCDADCTGLSSNNCFACALNGFCDRLFRPTRCVNN